MKSILSRSRLEPSIVDDARKESRWSAAFSVAISRASRLSSVHVPKTLNCACLINLLMLIIKLAQMNRHEESGKKPINHRRVTNLISK